jgi:hypothetical protein
MQTVYEDAQFRVVSRDRVGDCDTVIPNWTVEECRKGQWTYCAREFSKFAAMQAMRERKKRLH